MPDQPFIFEVYRLNKEAGEPTLFDPKPKQITSDSDISRIIEHATSPTFSYTSTSATRTTRWDLREFAPFDTRDGEMLHVTLAASTVKRTGSVVTDDGIEIRETADREPIADIANLFFYMHRHLLVVEHVTVTGGSHRWLTALEDLLDRAAVDLGYAGRLVFEPVQQRSAIINEFESFDRLTRLKLTLRLPNPDFSRDAEALYQMMKRSDIKTYTQDMRNPDGISRDKGGLPYSSIEIAESGYKKDDVVLTGYKDKRLIQKRIGKKAARGAVERLKDFAKGLAAAADTKEGKRFANAMIEAIDAIQPKDKR